MSDDRKCTMCGKSLTKNEEHICSRCESGTGKAAMGIVGGLLTVGGAVTLLIKSIRRKK